MFFGFLLLTMELYEENEASEVDENLSTIY